MKHKTFFIAVYLLVSTTAFAELSAVSTQRVLHGMDHCQRVDNELLYKEYWGDSVKPENLKEVCIAEQFADQVTLDGDVWLENQSRGLIEFCRSQSDGQEPFYSCLKISLDKAAKEISTPCVELEVQQLWSEEKCRRLVSYLFMKKFETILEAKPEENIPQVEEVKQPAAPVDMIKPELSLTNTWRIEQAIERCDQSKNELTYKKYWQDSVNPENQKTVCIAEQFADQVAADGDAWLEKKANDLIDQCEMKGRKDVSMYTLCLERNIDKNAKVLSLPCNELGEKKLWSTQECEHLVSYIFISKFEKILLSRKPLLDRLKAPLDELSEGIFFKFFVNPVMAILLFILYVLDVIFLIEGGTWMRVTKAGLFLGPLILLSCFTYGGLGLLSSGITMVAILMTIAWNHRVIVRKKEKPKPVPIEF